jgi:hypothetical protein
MEGRGGVKGEAQGVANQKNENSKRSFCVWTDFSYIFPRKVIFSRISSEFLWETIFQNFFRGKFQFSPEKNARKLGP